MAESRELDDFDGCKFGYGLISRYVQAGFFDMNPPELRSPSAHIMCRS
jgi:hypothetical protein